MAALIQFFLLWFGRLAAWFVGQRIAWLALRVAFIAAAVIAVMNVLPVPDWLEALPGRIQSLPGSLLWFASLCELPFGVSVVVGAYVFRFVLRRALALLGAGGS